jgi:hypothetical protein
MEAHLYGDREIEKHPYWGQGDEETNYRDEEPTTRRQGHGDTSSLGQGDGKTSTWGQGDEEINYIETWR